VTRDTLPSSLRRVTTALCHSPASMVGC
jgi:hypothetical protein